MRDISPGRFWKAVWLAGLPADERARGWVSALTDSELSELIQDGTDHPERLLAVFRDQETRGSTADSLSQLLYFDTRLTLADQLLMIAKQFGLWSSTALSVRNWHSARKPRSLPASDVKAQVTAAAELHARLSSVARSGPVTPSLFRFFCVVCELQHP